VQGGSEDGRRCIIPTVAASFPETPPELMSALTYTHDELLLSVAAGPQRADALTASAETASDHSLLEATCAGDEAAFAELVRRYRNQLTNYIYRITNDYDASVDLAQETFVRLYRAAGRYRQSHAFSTYIYRIATNLAISELRRRKRRRLISLSGFFQGREQDGGEPCELDPPDERPLQDSTLIEGERRAAVARAIATLPDKYRAPLVLRDVEGRSYDEIARILEMSEGTVKSRINRARSFLRDKLQAYL
jgi:RNA polymerase sigma-70 factor, ECF subfamily